MSLQGHWMHVEPVNRQAWPDHGAEAARLGDAGLVLLREALNGDDEAAMESADLFQQAWRHALIEILGQPWEAGDPDRRQRDLLVAFDRRVAALTGGIE